MTPSERKIAKSRSESVTVTMAMTNAVQNDSDADDQRKLELDNTAFAAPDVMYLKK